jgi:hypothetical protein
MKYYSRLPLCVGIAVVLAVLFVSLLVKLSGAGLKENLNLTIWTERFLASLRRRQELEVQGIPVVRRTFEKHRIVQDLLAHRLTLWQAADEFRELDEEVHQAKPLDTPSGMMPPFDEEKMCRNVIVWVRVELSNQPDVANKVADELERQASAHLWQHN